MKATKEHFIVTPLHSTRWMLFELKPLNSTSSEVFLTVQNSSDHSNPRETAAGGGGWCTQFY